MVSRDQEAIPLKYIDFCIFMVVYREMWLSKIHKSKIKLYVQQNIPIKIQSYVYYWICFSSFSFIRSEQILGKLKFHVQFTESSIKSMTF